MIVVIRMEETKPETGKYSVGRTRFGNVLVGRRKGKSKTRVAEDMQDLMNLNVHHRATRQKFKSAGKRALASKIRELS